MRIVVNCRSILLSNRTGIGRYTYNLLDQLGTIDTTNQYSLYAQKKLFDTKRKLPAFNYPNFTQAVGPFSRTVPSGDIYHLPCPAEIEKFNGKVMVTIHDLIHKTYPQSHTQETIDLTEKHMQGIIARADQIICTSESTRHDLHRFYDFPQTKSCAVLNGVDHKIFYSLKDKSMARHFLKTKNIGDNFLLFVGTLEPRKNLLGLLYAMAMLKSDIPLVVVGMKGWMTENIAPKIKELRLDNRIIFTGFISDQELNFLYNTCAAFVFPSFYEGFGFPIVEAFSAGACVICSGNSSCKEIATDAAILIDPSNPQTMAQTIQGVLDDPKAQENHKIKGLRRGQDFSFSQTATSTLKMYMQMSEA